MTNVPTSAVVDMPEPTSAVAYEPPLFQTPDVTTAQILAVVQAIVGFGIAFGLNLTTEQQHAIMLLCSTILVVWPTVDAIIRHGRAIGNARKK